MTRDGRIREERFRQGRSKAVDYSPLFVDRTGLIGIDAEISANLIEIIRCIGAGNLIPEKFYRNGVGRDGDPLLVLHGIKHLHLHENTDVDALLFLIEYNDFVLLLGVDGHRQHFSKPEGAVLRSLHDSAIRNADAKAERLQMAKLASSRTGLRPRGSPNGE